MSALSPESPAEIRKRLEEARSTLIHQRLELKAGETPASATFRAQHELLAHWEADLERMAKRSETDVDMRAALVELGRDSGKENEELSRVIEENGAAWDRLSLIARKYREVAKSVAATKRAFQELREIDVRDTLAGYEASIRLMDRLLALLPE